MRLILSACLAAAALSPLAARAHTVNYVAELRDLQGLGVSGRATVAYDAHAQSLTVGLRASGLTPGMTHIQHIHGPFADTTAAPGHAHGGGGGALAGSGMTPADARTPTLAQDADGDGFIELFEGLATYGPVLFNLTDASGAFPTAPLGEIDFLTTYDLTTATNFGAGFGPADLLPLFLREIVVHGAFLSAGQGATTAASFGPNEADGTEGFKLLLPVLAGELVEVAPVPLPAAGWLTLAAMGGLAALRRRA